MCLNEHYKSTMKHIFIDTNIFLHFEEFEKMYFPNGHLASRGELMKESATIGNKFALDLLDILKK